MRLQSVLKQAVRKRLISGVDSKGMSQVTSNVLLLVLQALRQQLAPDNVSTGCQTETTYATVHAS